MENRNMKPQNHPEKNNLNAEDAEGSLWTLWIEDISAHCETLRVLCVKMLL